jgi:hypothetical protein
LPAYTSEEDGITKIARLELAMKRAFYSDSIANLLDASVDSIVGKLVQASSFSVESTQRDAWLSEISLLKQVLGPFRDSGTVYFEYVVPRLGNPPRRNASWTVRHSIDRRGFSGDVSGAR